MEDLATREPSRHLDEAPRAVEAYDVVSEGAEVRQVSAGTAPQVEDPKRARAFDRAEERAVVLRDVVVAGAFPEGLGARVVVRQGASGDRLELREAARNRPRRH